MNTSVRMKRILSFKNIDKYYNDRKILNSLNFDLIENEVVSIIGPSGSGKTTFLKMFNLLRYPDNGQIELFGEIFSSSTDISSKQNSFCIDFKAFKPRQMIKEFDIGKYRRNFGFVFQEFNLWPNLTLFDNIAVPLKWSLREKKSKVREMVFEAAKLVQIEDQLFKYPNEVSGGQQQRAGIARALVINPRVLLLDEITSALDPELVGETLSLISSLREKGRTLVIVTHHMQFAAQISDRIGFLCEGELLEISPPDSFFKNPQSDKARNFLSKFNDWATVPCQNPSRRK